MCEMAYRGLLEKAAVSLNVGLTGDELDTVERRFGFQFVPEHREFLRLHLPVGRNWPDWRRGDPGRLEEMLTWPVDGALFDVQHNTFWPASWGSRPNEEAEALTVARRHLEAAPKLVPVYGHRFLPAAPAPSPAPVFSVHQTDVIYYGRDLADYLEHEFGTTRTWGADVAVRIPFWSDLAEGVEDADL